MYLNFRPSLALNSNGSFVCKTKVFEAEATTQVQRAARVVSATLAFARSIEAEELEPDVFKELPFDMSQYQRMFGLTRLPGSVRDEHRKAPNPVDHIVVLCGAGFWKLQVIDGAGKSLSVAQLETQLAAVMQAASSSSTGEDDKAAGSSMALLTADDRAGWADTRKALEGSPTNVATLTAIDEALFHLSLDTCTDATSDLTDHARLALHGAATNAPRWFDKCSTLTVSADGVPYISFEHSWGDALALMRWAAELRNTIADRAYPTDTSEAALAPPTRLDWEVSPAITAARQRVAADFAARTSALRVHTVEFRAFGAKRLKRGGVSPDGCVQQALQLAFYRMHGHTPSTYEACSTAHFAAGRTETIRSVTIESADFVRAALTATPGGSSAGGSSPPANDAPSPSQIGGLLRAACARHAEVSKDAFSGRGFDRHLFALKAACAEGEALPALFTDPTYEILAGNELSTSTVSSPFVQLGIFGPVHPQGYGIAYDLQPNVLRFCITAYTPRSAVDMGDAVQAALRDLSEWLEHEP